MSKHDGSKLPAKAAPKSVDVPAVRVLTIASHHPDLVAGESQQAAYELFQALRAEPGITASFIGGAQHFLHPHAMKPGAPVWAYDRRPDEYLLGVHRFDGFWESNGGGQPGGWGGTIRFLQSLAPDILLFRGTGELGAELLRAARVACPAARIVVTLDDFTPICAADGRMVRTRGQGLCDHASPARCAQCFPDRTPAEMSLRTRWLKAQLAWADRFVVTSEFMRRRYLAWGLPEASVAVIRPALPAGAARKGPPTPARNRFGLFGTISDESGLSVALDAVAALIERGITEFELVVHGDLRRVAEMQQRRLREMAAGAAQIRIPAFDGVGLGYQRVAEVDWVLAPSLWWESAPRSVEAAFRAGRPVLCSDRGGLAERVANGISGLTFPLGDGRELADLMAHCLADPESWDRLAAGVPPVPMPAEQVVAYRALWGGVVAGK